MQRRSFLQALASAVFLPLVRTPAAQDEPPPVTPTYTDSDNNTPATLASLHDGQTQQGGISYGA